MKLFKKADICWLMLVIGFMYHKPVNCIPINSSETEFASNESEIVDLVQLIVNSLESYENRMRYGKLEEAVLIFGNNGTGKTALASTLSDFEPDSDESNNQNPPAIPQLMSAENTNTDFYDCPKFNKNQIFSTYFLQKVLSIPSSVKLVFSISYSSIKSENDDFIELTKNVVNFIKDIDKYRNGIALVVMNVEKENNLTDHTVIETVTNFLQKTKDNFSISNDDSSVDNENNDDKIKFIDILLNKQNNESSKITILRNTDQSESIENAVILNEKEKIKLMINENIQYIEKSNFDFNYEISDVLIDKIPELIDEIQNRLMAAISVIDVEIENYFVSVENLSPNLVDYFEVLKVSYKKFSELKTSFPRLFLKQLEEISSDFGMDISSDLDSILNHYDFFEFLKMYNGNSSEENSLVFNLPNSINLINESFKWYGFLINLQDFLSINNLDEIVNVESLKPNEMKSIVDIGLKPVLDHTKSKFHLEVENMPINSFQLEKLISILHQNTVEKMFFKCTAKLTVTGKTIKISDVLVIPCYDYTHLIEVFALNKLIIDVDINKTGKGAQISLIAPAWEISGKRKIILDGAPGKEQLDANARSGVGLKKNGEIGKPGWPGGNGGGFLGIGDKFINDRNLEIHVNGGKGGSGQHGGNGSTHFCNIY